MKKFFPLRYVTAIFFFPFSTLLLCLQTKALIQVPSFRISFLFAVVVYGIMIFAFLKSYLKREDGSVACIWGIQSACFIGADIISEVLIKCREDESAPVRLGEINPWIIQILWLVVVLALIILTLPVARRTFSRTQKCKENGMYAHNQKRTLRLWLGGQFQVPFFSD